jgi:hypothetical protein
MSTGKQIVKEVFFEKQADYKKYYPIRKTGCILKPEAGCG